MRLSNLVHVILGVCAFSLANPSTCTGQTSAKEDVSIVARGPHHKIIQRVTWVTDDVGAVSTRTNFYTELATGLHYREGEQWLASEAKIELLPNNAGAAASKGQHKVIFPAEIKSGAIELNTPDNQWLRSRVWGLSYFDEATGKSVLLAAVQKSEGQLVGDNTVIYPDAFTDVLADIKYHYSLSGFEQDVVIRQQLATPESLGLNPKTTRLQVLTEFVEAPAPAKTSQKIGGLSDQSLGFGQMSIGTGKAFSVDAEGDTTGQVPVAKSWTPLEDRNFLIEEVYYERVADQLQKLPAAVKYKGASLRRRGTGENVIAGLKKLMPKRYAKAVSKPGNKQMAQAKAQTSPSFVMDYVILNTSQNNYTFKGDTTYYVSGVLNMSGTTTFEGGTVIKYAINKTINIVSLGIAKTVAAAYRPVIFTAKDDNTVGAIISGSSGSPGNGVYYANPALTLQTLGNPALQNVRFLYAQQAISTGWGLTLDIAHAQFVKCYYGVVGNQSLNLNLKNALFGYVVTPLDFNPLTGGATISAQQVTFDNSAALVREGITGAYALNFTNCILANVPNTGWSGSSGLHLYGNNNGFYNTPISFGANNPVPSPVNPFQPQVGRGNYYLAAGCNFVGAGTEAIDATLLAELTRKTTQPPLVYNGTPTTLSPRNLGDLDAPDLGYHYDVLDYCVSGVSGTHTLASGVAIGIYGPYGFQSGTLVSVGTPTRHNQIALYSAVQEQPVAWGANASATYLLNTWNSATRFQFTDILLAGSAGVCFSSSANSLEVTDCFLHGAELYITGSYYATLGLTNNILERCDVSLLSCYGGTYYANFYNNLLLNGNLAIGGACNGIIAQNSVVKNNLFVKGAFTFGSGGTPQIFNNGYNLTTLTHPGSAFQNITTLDFQSGPLDGYYYPNSQITSGDLFTLIDSGSGTSTSLGLDTYTTRADQSPDSSDPVDIGYHHVPVYAPTANPATVPTCRNMPKNITLSGFDPIGFPLTYTVVAKPVNGTLTGSGQNRTYTPYSGYEGPDSFRFKVSNGILDSFEATISIGVGGAPNAVNQNAMVGQWSAAHPLSASITLIGTDGCNDPLTHRITRQPTHGTATLTGSSPNCTYAPTPNVNFVGLDDFDFVVNDGVFDSDPATVSINIAPGPLLDAHCGYSRIYLSWDITVIEQLFGNDYVSGFKIYRGNTSGGPYNLITLTMLAQNVRTFADASVLPGQNYFYVVTFIREEPDVINPTTIYTYESQYSNEKQIQTCPLPPPDPIDVAFIIDTTGSMGGGTLNTLRAEIADVLEDIEGTSGGSYRLAMVIPDNDLVKVLLNFSDKNRNNFETILGGNIGAVGNNEPESTDECLNTVVNERTVIGRIDQEACGRVEDLQNIDFTPFRSTARKYVVLITDNPPGGFCDDYDENIDKPRAHQYAQQARNRCIKINAIQVALGNGTFQQQAVEVMLDYAQTSCVWHPQLPHTGVGIGQAIRDMLHTAGACSCQ